MKILSSIFSVTTILLIMGFGCENNLPWESFDGNKPKCGCEGKTIEAIRNVEGTIKETSTNAVIIVPDDKNTSTLLPCSQNELKKHVGSKVSVSGNIKEVCPNQRAEGVPFVVKKIKLITPQTQEFGEPFEVKYNDSVVVSDSEDKVNITFTDVVQDSRCPADAMCIRQGEAIIELLVAIEGEEQIKLFLATSPVEFNGTQIGPEADVAGYHLKLEDLQPYPLASDPAEESEYVAKLIVTKK